MRSSRSSHVRIIGGIWKGRKLPVAPGVRPTPDRAKVTLFNWLAGELPGARVLDLFAGSGALGFEALSRGADHLTLVERNRAAADLLLTQSALLGATRAVVERADARQWLLRQPPDARWNLAFLDPPFDSDLLAPALVSVAARLADGGRVFVECSATEAIDPLAAAAGLVVCRESVAGAARYGLLASDDGVAARAG